MKSGSPSQHSVPARLTAEQADVAIRLVTEPDEFRACVDVQAEVWGPEWSDTVPASLLQVAGYVGGLVIGAFTTSGELAGFLFGLTGLVNGDVVHWSHMLGVRSRTRDLGVGRLLKEFQRAELARRGIGEMRWTFDPLVAKNAHFNLNRLGARVVDYVSDMYGKTSSPLHFGLATDRLVVACDTGKTAAPSQEIEVSDGPALELGLGRDGAERSSEALSVHIEIPADIGGVLKKSPATAAQWRDSVREHFTWALGEGYSVSGLMRDPVSSRSFYVLTRSAR